MGMNQNSLLGGNMTEWPFPVVHGVIPGTPKPSASLTFLLDWVNTHDCGVTPTGVYTPDCKGIVIRVECLGPTGRTVEEEIVYNLAQAKDALGY